VKGSIPLKIMEKVQKNDYKKKKNCFEIQTPDRNYHLFASTGEVPTLPFCACRRASEREACFVGACVG
jgi:hypothetical protein